MTWSLLDTVTSFTVGLSGSVSFDSTPSAGDLLVFLVGVNAGAAVEIIPPEGVMEALPPNPSVARTIAAYYRVADGLESDPFEFSVTGETDRELSLMARQFSGAVRGDPLGSSSVYHQASTTDSATTEIDAESGSLLVAIGYSTSTAEKLWGAEWIGQTSGSTARVGSAFTEAVGGVQSATLTLGSGTNNRLSVGVVEFLSGPHITSVSSDGVVVDGQGSVDYSGSLLDPGAISATFADGGGREEAWPVTGASETGGTATESRGVLQYGPGVFSVGGASKAVRYDPPDGFVAYPLHPDYANQTSGESILAGLTITSGMQIKVPSSVVVGGSPIDIAWEVSSGYATGRIALLGTEIKSDVELSGVELHDGESWDDLPVTMIPERGIATPGIVIELTTRNGSPPPNHSGVTAVVRESVTANDVLYQTNDASITSGVMTLNSPLIGNVGDTVCVTLLSPDGKTGGLWPEAPVIDLSAT